MLRSNKLKIAFYVNLLVVVGLVAYKIYLNVSEGSYEAVNALHIRAIQNTVKGKANFSFAVVGNINNSIGIFERKIVPMLNASDVDFVVSAGNAVSAGGEDKYRAVHGSFEKLQKPHLLTFGPHEADNFGGFRFYRHYGPYFFSFDVNDNRFVFLDATGETPAPWQLNWLEEQLHTAADNVFVFMGRPPIKALASPLFEFEDNYLPDGHFRKRLLALMDEYDVTAVFSTNLPLYSHRQNEGIDYFITGGAGGLVIGTDNSFYHFLRVEVAGNEVTYGVERLNIGQHGFFRIVESLWFFIHSLFYVGFLNFILLLSALVVVGIKLYGAIFVDRDYYRNYEADPDPFLNRSLRVAMFTNNYLPFIGGVPLSIERLSRGLRALGDEILIFAPRYDGHSDDESGIVRVPTLLAFGAHKALRLTNIFSLSTVRALRRFRPHLIHLHHPFWLGWAGLWLARRLKVPTVFTYHTRLEHYAHFVPIPGPLFRNLISHQLVKRFANQCDGVIVPTYSAEEYLRVIGVKTPIQVLPTGIDFDKFRQVDEGQLRDLRQKLGLGEARILVSASRLSQEKNIDFMIDAVAPLLLEAKEDVRLLIIGEGRDRVRLQHKIDDLGLTGRIRLLGAVPPAEMPLYYRLGETFLFASKSETQGMVVLEAMAAGMPVVAVRSSGIDDLVQDGDNGFKTREDHRQWRERIEGILADEALRRRLGANALATARQHDTDNFARQMRENYAQVLARHRARRPTQPGTPQAG